MSFGSHVARNMSVARGVAPGVANTTVFTVPTGFVLLLKSIVISNETTVATETMLWVYDAAQTVFARVFTESLASMTGFAWYNWVPMNEGDSIFLGSQTSDIQYWIGGALLTPFAGIPPTTAQLPGPSYPWTPTPTPPLPSPPPSGA